MASGYWNYLFNNYYWEYLKPIFGNKKNFNRFLVAHAYANWNRWLFSLGYRG